MLVWSKVNMKIEISELVNKTKSWQEVVSLRIISLLLYCTFEAIFIWHIACVNTILSTRSLAQVGR